MKRLLSLSLAAALLLLLSACGSSSGGGDFLSENGSSGGSMTYTGQDMFDGISPAAIGEEALEPGSEAAAGRKVIYTADIRMETTDFDAATEALNQIVEEFSGYFENRSITNYDAYRSGRYTVRVPAAEFEAFCAQAGEICHVTDLQTGEENVGEAYYDIEARLATQRTKLERLQELLSEADNMADIITIESAISDTELQIEYLTGSLRHYDALIDYATATITLLEVYRLSNVQEVPQGFGGRVAEALRGGFTGAVTVLEELVLLLARIWVLLVILIPLFVVVFRRRRKRRLLQGAEDSLGKK